jgi:hypothetical protein
MPPTLTTTPPPPKPTAGPVYRLSEQTGLQDAIHAPHQKARDRTMEALYNSEISDLQRQAVKMSDCAASVHLFFDPARGTVREFTHTCKARLCPYCGRRRSAHVAAQMMPLISAMKRARHLVLTVKSKPGDLRNQVRDLVGWFAKLRRTPFWKQNVYQGVYTIEITVNERTGLWHPHVHIIFDGQYMPQAKLRYLWHNITNGSEIVWIEEAYSTAGLVQELCKYIGKPQKSEHWTDAQLVEYAQAVRGMRMVQTFGKRHPTAITDDGPEDEKQREDQSMSVARLCWLAQQDNAAAVAALPKVATRWPHLGRYIYARFPQLMPDRSREERLLRALAIIDAGRAPPEPVTPTQAADVKQLEAEICELLDKASLIAAMIEKTLHPYDEQRWTGI